MKPITARAILASLMILGAAPALARDDHGPSEPSAAAPASAHAGVYTAFLNGANERPTPLGVTGTGFGTVSLADDLNTLTVSLSFEGLTSGTLAGHIHCCGGPEVAAPVAVNFATSGVDPFPFDVTSGLYERIFDLSLASTYGGGFLASNGGNPLTARDTFVSGLNAGLTYLNIHTRLYPGGELRGQLNQVPEPAMVGLMLVGVLGIAFGRRALAA